MIRVTFEYPDGTMFHHEMKAVPSRGDQVVIKNQRYRVVDVIWRIFQAMNKGKDNNVVVKIAGP